MPDATNAARGDRDAGSSGAQGADGATFVDADAGAHNLRRDAATEFSDDASTGDASAGDGIPKGENIVAMVAPSVCTTQLGRMFDCDFGTVEVAAVDIPTSGEFKTRVAGHLQGDCAGTAYPFVAKLSASGIAAFDYNLTENAEVWLRRDDSAALSSMTVTDGSGWARHGNYGASCRVWIEINFNERIKP